MLVFAVGGAGAFLAQMEAPTNEVRDRDSRRRRGDAAGPSCFVEPYLSTDIYRYVWTAACRPPASPYRLRPSAPRLRTCGMRRSNPNIKPRGMPSHLPTCGPGRLSRRDALWRERVGLRPAS